MTSAAPRVGGTRVVSSTKTLFWLIGGGVDVAAGYVQRSRPGPAWALAAMGVVAVVLGTVTWLAGPRMPRWSRHVLFTVAVALCTVTVLTTTSPQSAIALAGGFAFVTLDALVFYPPRQAAGYLLVAVAASTGALLSRPDIAWGPVVIHDVVLLAPLVVIARLVRRAAAADRDALTGLANRRGFDAAAEAALTAAGRTRRPLSVAVLDVDHFKAVNDSAGHLSGDELLQRLATCWSAQLPAGAHLARYGGDEFTVVLPDHTGPAAFDILEGLRRAATAATGVGLSCAVAQWRCGETANDLVRRIDTALYQAKAAGRGRSVLAGGRSGQLALDLAEALRRTGTAPQPATGQPPAPSGLEVYYQPVVSLPGGEVVGLEALARWTHPEHGPVPPAEFIALAEAEDLIGPLGAFVLARACTQAAQLRAATGRDLFLTVNVSGAELISPDYPDLVAATLRRTSWPPTRLVLEVTESLIDADSAPALAALRRLAGLGIGVAIDDFGTGYSALSRLDTLPATHLKLDHTFTATVTREARGRLVGAVAALADAFGLQLIAEGVETAEQAAALTALGAPLAQGYLYHRPQPLAELLSGMCPTRQTGPTAAPVTGPAGGVPAPRSLTRPAAGV